MSNFKTLRERLGMNRSECAQFLKLKSADEITIMENDTKDIHQEHQEKLARLDAMVETAVFSEVDIFSQINEREVILIRFLNNEAFALFEPKLFEELGSSSIHENFIARTKKAIERIGGEVTVAFMDTEFYEAWLGVNDFDDSRELRVAWARQQARGLGK